jgi:hypothetical protein
MSAAMMRVALRGGRLGLTRPAVVQAQQVCAWAVQLRQTDVHAGAAKCMLLKTDI